MLEESETEKGTLSVIIFEVEGEQFAIDLLHTREIIQKGQIRRLPQTFEFIEGIYNYRGDIIYVINLSKKLELHKYKSYKSEEVDEDLEESDETYLVIVNINNINTGLLVDRIINISHIKNKEIIGLSPIFETSISMEYIDGIIKFKDRPRILLNIDKILTEAEQVKIQKELN
jgi:purine-binding chemotaxis protein CheW